MNICARMVLKPPKLGHIGAESSESSRLGAAPFRRTQYTTVTTIAAVSRYLSTMMPGAPLISDTTYKRAPLPYSW